MTAAASRLVAGARARTAAVVLLGAVVDACLAWRFGASAPLAAYLVFGTALTAVSATDVRARRIPDRVVVPAYVCGAALLVLASRLSGQWSPLARAGIASVLLCAFYLALGLFFPGQMGMGDVKLAGLVGLFLGWLGWGPVVIGTLVAFSMAALFVLTRRMASRPKAARSVVAMAPFMAAGALVAVLVSR